jgi:regulator of sigma E protease
VGFLQPLFWVVILLGVMILIHELGHFWAALAVGIQVDTFSIGFGPRLLGMRRGETDFRISAIPFGGYVKMAGDQSEYGTYVRTAEQAEEEQPPPDPRSFQAKPRWQRAIVIVAGPLMNVILAVGIVAGLYMYAYPKQLDTTNPVITAVDPGSAAAAAGLQPGDRIVQLEDKSNPNWDFVMTEEALNANHPIHGTVERHGKRVPFTVTPRMDPKAGIGTVGWSGEQNIQIGEVTQDSPAAKAGLKPGDLFLSVGGKAVVSPVTVQQAVFHSYGKPVDFQVMRNGHILSVSVTPTPTSNPKMPFHIGIGFQMPVQMVKLGFGPAFEQSLRFNRQNALMVFQVLGGIIERRVSPKSLSGPIGIAQMSSQAAQAGAWSYLLLMAFLSLQLAIFNLLPIPILDGGTLLMLIIEMLLQREVSLHVKETIFKVGFVFLMMVVVFVIYNDISRILTQS